MEFKLVSRTEEPTISKWLEKPHVREYFHGEGLANTYSDLAKQLIGEETVFEHYIAYHNGQPFAYLLTSDASHLSQKKSRTLDVLIGEESFLGKKLSYPLITAFLNQLPSDIEEVYIDPEVGNERAIHIYEKLGFKKVKQFIAEWNPVPHWLMVLELAPFRSGQQVHQQKST